MLEEAVKLDPKLALAYQYLGYAEYADRQRAEALADFTRAIELDPKNALTRFLRAYLESTQRGAVGDDAQMEEDLRAAIAISPEFAPPYGVLAVHLANRGENLPEALKLAQKAQALEPGNTGYQIDMAQVLARMNRYADARSIAVRARANASNPVERAHAEQFLAYLQQVEQYSRGASEAAGPSSGAEQASSTPPSPKPVAGADSPDAGQAKVQAAGGDAAGNSGTLREATGVVTKLSCSAGLKIELNSGTGSVTLHVKAGTSLRIQMATPAHGPFNPCTELQGQRVKVAYQPDDAKGKVGTLASLIVLSGTGDDGSGATGAGGGRRLGVGAGHRDPVTASAEGNVKQVDCTGNELTLQLDAADGLHTLHARDATRVQFEQDVAFDAGGFQPCSQLKGRMAKITFVEVDGKTYDGEIQGVEVER